MLYFSALFSLRPIASGDAENTSYLHRLMQIERLFRCISNVNNFITMYNNIKLIGPTHLYVIVCLYKKIPSKNTKTKTSEISHDI